MRLSRAGKLLLLVGTATLVAGMLHAWPAAVAVGWAQLLALLASAGHIARGAPPSARFEAPMLRAGSSARIQVVGEGEFHDGTWKSMPGEIEARFEEPGVRELPVLRVRVHNGLWIRESTFGGTSVTVLPSLAELAQATRSARRVVNVLRGKSRFGVDDVTEPEGIRAWTEGTSARFIDWKASSRFEGLLERSFPRVQELDLEILVDASSAARRKESATAHAPIEVALPTVLHLIEWGRSHGRRIRILVVDDDGTKADMDATTPSGALERLLDSLPVGLPEDPLVPDSAPSTFQSLLRRMRSPRARMPLVRALSGKGSGTALFVVSPLDLAPERVRELGGVKRSHRVLVQVGELEGAAATEQDLERLYPRVVRRRRNAAILASLGWTIVDASHHVPRAQMLRTIARKVEP